MSTTANRTQPHIATYAADTGPGELAWMLQGRCATTSDPNAWHPANEEGTGDRTRTARRLCRACPVAAACLDYALNRRWLTGIWADTTTDQRYRMRRAQRRKAA